jgi:hypothetical protein
MTDKTYQKIIHAVAGLAMSGLLICVTALRKVLDNQEKILELLEKMQ